LKTALECFPDYKHLVVNAVEHVSEYHIESSKLTKDESAAIRLYTGSWVYEGVNGALRTQGLAEIQPWFAYLKIFHNTIKKLTSQNVTYCRGEKGNWIDSYDIGSNVTLVSKLLTMLTRKPP
jgi:hypothetical protein